MYAPNKPKPTKKEEAENEEGENEEEAEEAEEERAEEPQDEFFAVVANDVVERLVVRPEDTLPYVESSLSNFKEALLKVLEDQMANMDQSYLIELDSNLSPTILIKQLILRLESYPIRKAAKVLRMAEPLEVNEEEAANTDHFIDTIEIEENLTSLQSKKKLSGKFKWRRSKCAFYCPVSLKDGKIVSGKPDFAASFLDKIYLMADENRLKEFLKNPRPYLRLPQPRAPCKLSILGTPYSGKTSLSALLAKKYNASVIDMKSLMEPKIKKASDELRERVSAEATQSAIEQIKQKFREKLEQEKTKRDQEQAERAALLAEGQEGQENQQEQDGQEEENKADGEQDGEEKQMENDEFEIQKEQSIINEPIDYGKLDANVVYSEEGEITVNLDHPDIQLAVDKALDDLAKQQFSLPPSDYIKVLQEELDRIRKSRAKVDQTAPNDGGWILDNFPNDSEQLNAMAESNIIPDTFIVLQDTSEDSSILLKRWYQLNKNEIDQRITNRLADEARQKEEKLKK